MRNFIVIYVKGSASLSGGGVAFESLPGKHQFLVEGTDKFDAYARTYRHFSKLGMKVSVERGVDGMGNALNFTEDEIKVLMQDPEVAFSTEYATGIRIQGMIRSI